MERLIKMLDADAPRVDTRVVRVGYVVAITLAALLLCVGLAVYGRMREWHGMGPWRDWMGSIPAVAMSYGTLLLLAAAIVESRVRHVHAAAWARRARELDGLVAALTDRQEKEYEALSGRLHDDVGAVLAAARFEADAALAKPGADAAARQRLLDTLDHAIGEVRGLSATLFPRMVAQFGLSAGLREIAQRFEAAGMRVLLEIDPAADRVGPELARVLARAAQEGLVNARRHGQAGQVRIRLEQCGGRIEGLIEDNGSGCGENAHEGLGLSLLRERLRRLGGQMRIEPRPEGGAALILSVPVQT
ncbi:MAG: histidine kinase [Kiritimatiellae bacterium]|nr:histidine kinase [Kiritimatiellia bacterium]